MSKIKLLPCPFCGGEAIECKTKVICSECTCTVYGRNIDIARKLWNTRKPMERIIEQLEHEKQEDNELLKFHCDNGTKSMEGLYVGKVNAFKDAIMIVKEEGVVE